MSKRKNAGNVIRFPQKGRAAEPETEQRWKTSIECLEEASADIKSGKLNPDWLFLGTADGLAHALEHPDTITPDNAPSVQFQHMGMNTMELVGFLTMFINALLRGDFS